MADTDDDLKLSPEEQAAWDAQLPDKDPAPEPEPLRQEAPPEASPELAQADDDDDGGDSTPEGFVQLRRFQKFKERAKNAEERLRQLELENARLAERTEAFMRQNQPQQVPQPQQPAEPAKPAPTPDEDIFGAVEHQGKTVAQIQRDIEAYKQQQAREQQKMAVVQAGMAQVQEFMRAGNADYPQAYEHFMTTRINELRAQGCPEDRLSGVIENEILNITAGALQRRVNPGQVFYQMAQYRGYQKPAPAAPQADPAEAIERQAEVQSRSRSLSSGGGSAPALSDDLSLRAVLRMRDEDFAKFMSNAKNADKFDRLLGKPN